MLLGITKPCSKDTFFDFPVWFACLVIHRQNSVGVWPWDAAPQHRLFDFAWISVKTIDLVATGNDPVMPETVLGVDLPKKLARMTIKADQGDARGTVQTLGSKSSSIVFQILVAFKFQSAPFGVFREPKTTDQNVFIDTDVTPVGDFV